jgi:precorrin-6A/cobalt-precorrin-6A reductase
MGKGRHILLQAYSVAQALDARAVSHVAWMSEAPRGSLRMAQMPLLRRFAGCRQMQEAIAQGGFDAVLDAAHSFDRRATGFACAAAQALGLPYLRLERAPWELAQQPHWCRARDAAQACAMTGPGARVFSTTGWDSLPDFAGFAGDAVLLRQTRAHRRPAPYPFVQLVFGDPPFTPASEQALFALLRVDTLICRNIGGTASMPKLEAARALGLAVIVIDRPAAPAGMQAVARVADALDWVARL